MNALMAGLAFVVLAGFIGILIVSVPSPDLVIVGLVTIGFVAWDMIASIRNKTY